MSNHEPGPIESDAPWEDDEYSPPPGPLPYEVTSEPDSEALEEGLGGAESASKPAARPRQVRGRARLPKPPELDYGRDNGVGGIPWQKPCAWCGVIHGPSRSQTVIRERHYRYLRTRRNGGFAPTKVHGYTTYVNWGCACGVCNDANNEVSRKNREKRRAKKEAAAQENADA